MGEEVEEARAEEEEEEEEVLAMAGSLRQRLGEKKCCDCQRIVAYSCL